MPPNFAADDPAFQLFADLVHERTGLYYDGDKSTLLLDKITPLVAERGLTSLLDYYYLLKYSEQAETEWQHLAAALAVNETYFWREFDQINAAVKVLVPRLQEQNPGRPVRIWHAACATGEEPYSMAIALEQAGRFDRGPIEIAATDLNPEAIAHARAGIYRKRSFRTLPVDIFTHDFHAAGHDRYRLDDRIRARVQFSTMNLMDDLSMRRMQNYDMIFCRNVFIYFSNRAIERAAQSFYRSLNPSGYLFVAAVESLLRISTPFELVEVDGAFAYRKRN